MEWERLKTLIAALQTYKVPGTDLGKPNKYIQDFFTFFRKQKRPVLDHILPQSIFSVPAEIQARGWPTNADGKTATYWADRACMQNCYVCDSTPTDILHRVIKEPREDTYIFGIRALHVRLRIFDWLCKFYFHWPWKTASCRLEFYEEKQKKIYIY